MGASELSITRKDMLETSLLGSAALFLPFSRRAGGRAKIKDRLASSGLPKPFGVPFAMPPVLKPRRVDAKTDYYEITTRKASAKIVPGLRTEIWGYEGIAPGPTIQARRGRDVVVRHTNRTNRSPSVHLHGNTSPPQ